MSFSVSSAYAKLRLIVDSTTNDTLPSLSNLGYAANSLPSSLPTTGLGEAATETHLLQDLTPGFNGPKTSSNYYGFVTGGVFPIAEVADNIVTAFDQNVQVHLSDQSVATAVEDKALSMLVELLDLGDGWAGKTFTTGATGANVMGLACGREAVVDFRLKALGESSGVGELGILGACLKAGIKEIQVLTTMGHSSLYKAGSIVGLGRASVKDIATSKAEPWKMDVDALERELQGASKDVVSIVALSMGEVNTGRFATDGPDMLQRVRDICDKYGAWLHIDGAFGIFARCLPSTDEFATLRKSASGVELADSICGDAHKMLNVPYDCGFFLTRSSTILSSIFQNPNAAYLSAGQSSIPSPLNNGLENSRRFRALPVYAVLLAYGRAGLAEMFARQVQLARGISKFLTESEDFELLATGPGQNGEFDDVHIIVIFKTKNESINADLVQRINATRKMYVSGTKWDGNPACRIALSTWKVDVERDLRLAVAYARQFSSSNGNNKTSTMSFGFGVGDFIAVGKLAWSVYKSCKDAPESFGNITAEVLSLHAVLKEVEEALAEEPLTESKQLRLATIGSGCHGVLEELQALVTKYESLGSQSRRTWDRMRWGSNDIAELRARLTSNTGLLTAFLVTSQVAVQRRLNRFVEEFQDGKHEGSVITVATVESLAPSEKETWRAIRKELENIGISVLAFEANRPFIMDWFQTAIMNGAFEERGIKSDHEILSSEVVAETTSNSLATRRPLGSDQLPPNPSSPQSGIQTPEALYDSERDVQDRQVASAPLQALSEPERNNLVAPTALTSAQKFQDNAIFKGSYLESSPRMVHPPRITQLMTRVLGYDTAFTKACEKGDLEAAKRLFRKGVDVNSWLLDSGADINLVDKHSRSPIFLSLRGPLVSRASLTELLLQRGAAINSETEFDYLNPLFEAARTGNTEGVDLLLRYGAEVRSAKEYSPLRVAITGGHEEAVRLIFEHVAKSDDKLHEHHGADMNYMLAPDRPVLTVVLENKEYDMANVLLSKGANVDWARDWLAVQNHLSVHHNSSEHICLMGRRLDFSAADNSHAQPLDWAVAHDYLMVAQHFVNLGA
ncbi:hypothetical protein VTL71DRAFT_10628 [Oculimacula yallundae]|uniref:L-2,4-diaminobutyrate decarboxylase n=1 Tax=Oculimacula yallundae TaxID=86028 RepID=A0ABR4CTT2_9HELO